MRPGFIWGGKIQWSWKTWQPLPDLTVKKPPVKQNNAKGNKRMHHKLTCKCRSPTFEKYQIFMYFFKHCKWLLIMRKQMGKNMRLYLPCVHNLHMYLLSIYAVTGLTPQSQPSVNNSMWCYAQFPGINEPWLKPFSFRFPPHGISVLLVTFSSGIMLHCGSRSIITSLHCKQWEHPMLLHVSVTV